MGLEEYVAVHGTDGPWGVRSDLSHADLDSLLADHDPWSSRVEGWEIGLPHLMAMPFHVDDDDLPRHARGRAATRQSPR